MGSTRKHKPELLAPAGGMSQLQAAVRFGADAVYLAADKFGMRQRADNFHLADLPQAIDVAHAAGVRVYVAVNTLMSDADIADLPPYLEALEAARADAVIVSDLGALSLAKRYAPSLDIHVSTQASVTNAEAARMWHDLGARRVVLAREMSLDDIARLRAAAPDSLELEAFVHGAMCMAYSGRCLLSAAMTGRSGNKGHCAQPCRWSYALVEEKRPGAFYPIEEDARGTYVMNAYDLCMASHLDDLAQAGVDSFKIEGRNKRAFYVATVVHAYRSVLDGGSADAAERELLTISHRPYGTGFYYGEPAQRLERDGYVKECLHAATVLSCEPASAASGSAGEDAAPAACASGAGAPPSWVVRVVCHNRFREGDELEALSPRRDVRQLRVSGLLWLPKPEPGEAVPVPVPVAVANRTMEEYRFECAEQLQAGDLLRIRVAGASDGLSVDGKPGAAQEDGKGEIA